MMRWPRPNTAETRRDVRRRLIVGLSGLVGMFMVVLLASLLTGQARKQAADAQAQVVGGAAPADTANEGGNQPLVDLGVAPPIDEETKATQAPAAAPAVRPTPPRAEEGDVVVPDLQPDPKLQATQRQR